MTVPPLDTHYSFPNTVVSTSPLLTKWSRAEVLCHLNSEHHSTFRGIVDYGGGVIVNGSGKNIEITVFDGDIYNKLISQ